MDDVQAVQSAQYSFPYHYLPHLLDEGRSFAESRSWAYSLSYVTALRHVSAAIAETGSRAHLDIGCGDGALIHLLRQRHPDIELAGIDYDQRAIAWARMFTPDADFHAGDLHDAKFDTQWQSASLIEVIEHIPPDQLPHFMTGVHKLLPTGARLIVTVPHRNKPLNDKHYRHFSFDLIAEAVGEGFELETIFGFEFVPVWENLYRRLFSRPGFHLESPALNRIRLAYQVGRKDKDERKCGRIFATFRAK